MQVGSIVVMNHQVIYSADCEVNEWVEVAGELLWPFMYVTSLLIKEVLSVS